MHASASAGAPVSHQMHGAAPSHRACIQGAIAAACIMMGGLLERIKLAPRLAMVAMWTLVVYAPVCHAVAAGPGSLLGDLGVVDFGGPNPITSSCYCTRAWKMFGSLLSGIRVKSAVSSPADLPLQDLDFSGLLDRENGGIFR